MKRALPFFFTAVLLGCSRSAPPPHEVLVKAKANNHVVSTQISENQALDILLSALQERKIVDLSCLAFVAENNYAFGSKAKLWQFAVREIHNEKCGGDPEIMPVRDRYEVSAAGRVLIYDVASGMYKNF